MQQSHDVSYWVMCSAPGTEIAEDDANYPEIYERTLLPIFQDQPQWWPEAHRYVRRQRVHLTSNCLYCTVLYCAKPDSIACSMSMPAEVQVMRSSLFLSGGCV